MKKSVLFLAFMAFCLPAFAVDTLEDAIEGEADYIINKVSTRSIVAIVNIKSNSEALSEYIMEKMPDYVIGNRKNITFVDRQKLDVLRKEMDFQYSGEVDDRTMVALGKKLGAQIVVTGIILEAGTNYEFSIKVLDVETAKIIGSKSGKFRHDETMDNFLPFSSVAKTTNKKQQEREDFRAKTVKNVKTALGIFSNGIYLGYIGSVDAVFGLSLGWLSRYAAFFIDNEFGAPGFKGYNKGDISQAHKYQNENTAFRWNCLAGLNINIIPTLLWVSIGGGLEYKEEYYLYSSNDSGGKIWVKNSEKTSGVVVPGLFLKIWYFYIQAKYSYVIGEEFDISSLKRINLGVGYVWRSD